MSTSLADFMSSLRSSRKRQGCKERAASQLRRGALRTRDHVRTVIAHRPPRRWRGRTRLRRALARPLRISATISPATGRPDRQWDPDLGGAPRRGRRPTSMSQRWPLRSMRAARAFHRCPKSPRLRATWNLLANALTYTRCAHCRSFPQAVDDLWAAIAGDGHGST
jgi:hypothetical protein